MISIDKFKTVIENTPLISVDFLIENNEGKYLLGKRVNEPASGYWFTLGGRILKNEKLEDAITRLSKKEFNQHITLDMLKLHGIYEHFYKNSFVGANISTHYVVLAYKFKVNQNLDLPTIEHSEYNYFSSKEILENNHIHTYVKNYFKEGN